MSGISGVTTASRHNITTLPELRVVGGLHKGVCVALEGDSYSLGSTANEDIVLRDAGVKPQHAVLRIVGQDVRVEAMGGDLTVGGELLLVGHGCRLRMPVDILIGEASLHLSRNGDSTSLIAKHVQPAIAQIVKRPMIAASGVLFCALVATVASNGVQQSTDEHITKLNLNEVQTAALVSEQHVNDSGALPPGQSEPLNGTSIEHAKAKLSEMLQAAGILTLNVEALDGQLLVNGRISEEQELAWLATQRWFDETYAGKAIVLTSQVAIGGGSTPDLRLGAIWYGERPYVVLDDGLQYYEGANLGSGWVVQKITEDRLILKHPFKNETFALTY